MMFSCFFDVTKGGHRPPVTTLRVQARAAPAQPGIASWPGCAWGRQGHLSACFQHMKVVRLFLFFFSGDFPTNANYSAYRLCFAISHVCGLGLKDEKVTSETK